jgi:hypothetical protein
MLGFGAIFSLQVMNFFNSIFKDGLLLLEANIQNEVASGQGFGNPAQ